MRLWNWALAFGAVALVAGCGNQMLTNPVDPRPQGTEAGIRVDAQMGSFDGTSDAGISPPACTSACCNFVPPSCPPTAPTLGTPCGTPSAGACEYGDDPNIACNKVVECTSSGWVLEPGFGENQQASCPTICPPSFPGAVDGGIACPSSEQDLACGYPEGVCACLGEWSCESLPSDCPGTRPRAGTPCDVDGGCQTWGFDCGSDTMRCVCGIWSPSVCILI